MPRRASTGPKAARPRGFPRWAWWALFLATFTFALPATSPWWSTVLRGEIPDSGEEEGAEPLTSPGSASASPTVVPGSTLRVFLHTSLPDQDGLVRAEREIPYVRGVVPQIRAVVDELARSSPEVPALLPEGTRVLDVAYAKNGTVYVDFSSELELGRGVGADEERLLVQGIVTTITDNFTAVRRVVILVDGKAPKPGHLDLSRALQRDDPSFTLEETPEAEPDAAATPPARSAVSTTERPGTDPPGPPVVPPEPPALDRATR